jgi:hypothetical protein
MTARSHRRRFEEHRPRLRAVALLVVLDLLTPAERLASVPHESMAATVKPWVVT